MKLSGKIGWDSLNSVSKKLFEFDWNIFHRFKDHFFKVVTTNAMADGMPLLLNKDESPTSYSTGSLIPLGSSRMMRIC